MTSSTFPTTSQEPDESLRAKLKKSQVAVFGTCRNAKFTLAADLTGLDETTSVFGSRQYLLVESDSNDGTPEMLAQLALSRHDFSAISLGDLKSQIPLRTARLAHCRNIYRSAFTSDTKFADCDYVIIADLDRINDRMTSKKLLSCWSITQPWGVCTANRVGRYYDIFALRHPQWCPVDCHDDFRLLEPVLGADLAKKICIDARMIKLPERAAPVAVESAFGGFAIHTREAFHAGAPYVGLTDEGQETCEHVSFYTGMRASGHHIYIQPAMTAGGTREFAGKSILRKSRNILSKLVA